MAPSKSRKVFPYEELADSMKSRIATGELAAGAKLESIRAIAKREGLSGFTVSKAIDLLVEQGYLRKSNRRGAFVLGKEKREKKGLNIGVLVPMLPVELDRHGDLQRLIGEFQGLARHGHRISVHCCFFYPGEWHVRKWLPAQELGDLGLDALIITTIHDYTYLAELAQLRIPMVAVDVDAACLSIDSVAFDNMPSAFELTRVLIKRGHKRIIYLGGPLPPRVPHEDYHYDPSATERAEGYRLAMRIFAPGAETLEFHNEVSRSEEHWRNSLLNALNDAPDATAIVTEGPIAPEDLFGRDIEVARFCASGTPPSPGTVAVAECDYTKLGGAAARLLEDIIENPGTTAKLSKIMPTVRVLDGQE